MKDMEWVSFSISKNMSMNTMIGVNTIKVKMNAVTLFMQPQLDPSSSFMGSISVARLVDSHLQVSIASTQRLDFALKELNPARAVHPLQIQYAIL